MAAGWSAGSRATFWAARRCEPWRRAVEARPLCDVLFGLVDPGGDSGNANNPKVNCSTGGDTGRSRLASPSGGESRQHELIQHGERRAPLVRLVVVACGNHHDEFEVRENEQP